MLLYVLIQSGGGLFGDFGASRCCEVNMEKIEEILFHCVFFIAELSGLYYNDDALPSSQYLIYRLD